jgi:acyl-CoA thioesterase-1
MKAGYAAWRTWVQCMAMALLLSAFASTHAAKPEATAQPRTVLVMGDSLSAAYGLSAAQGWVALTADRIAKQKPGWKVVNASVSGETTAGGKSRIGRELERTQPDVVVIELGANDGLRGLPLAQTRANLDAMVTAAKTAGAEVLLIGMRLPPNFGGAYTKGFEENFRVVAKKHDVAFLPFLLEPIKTDRKAFQSDNLHPTSAAQPKLRDHVWPALAPLLR